MRRRQQNRRNQLLSTNGNRPLGEDVIKARLYSIADLAAYFRVNISTIHAWKKCGRLPEPLKRFGHKRWDSNEVNAWLKKREDPDGG